jgi:hypothetical protein
MITQELTLKELRFPHSQDKRTLLLNSVLNNVLGVKEYHKHNVYCEFRCNYPGRDYYFYIKTNRYLNSEILCENVLFLIEKVLSWYDLSDIENFDIKFEEGNKRHKCTYYDLVCWGYNRGFSNFGEKLSFSNKKLERAFKWVQRKMYNEKQEHEEKMKKALGGGRVFYENIDTDIKPKGFIPKGFIVEFKNKFIDFCHGII